MMAAYTGTWAAVVPDIIRLHCDGKTPTEIAAIAARELGKWDIVTPYGYRYGPPSADMISYIARRVLRDACLWGYPDRMKRVARRNFKAMERRMTQHIGGQVIDMGGQDGIWHHFVLGGPNE